MFGRKLWDVRRRALLQLRREKLHTNHYCRRTAVTTSPFASCLFPEKRKLFPIVEWGFFFSRKWDESIIKPSVLKHLGKESYFKNPFWAPNFLSPSTSCFHRAFTCKNLVLKIWKKILGWVSKERSLAGSQSKLASNAKLNKKLSY